MPVSFRPTFLRLIALSVLLLAGCNRPSGETLTPAGADELGTRVAATMTAVSGTTPTLPAAPAPSGTPTALPATATPEAPTPTADFDNVHGRVCYPGEAIPAMTIYFQEVESEAVIEVPVQAGQPSYSIKLPPGTYMAYAWLPDFARGGLYSKAVPCGLGQSCADHSPLTFEIREGAMVEGVDLCDWYGGPFAVPYPPGKEPGEVTGSVHGALQYPGGGSEIRVFFFNTTTQEWGYYVFKASAGVYTLPNLPPGTYHIVAYDENGRAGGHADAAHNLIPVTVKAGQTLDGIDINDWDAPAGAFPADPTR